MGFGIKGQNVYLSKNEYTCLSWSCLTMSLSCLMMSLNCWTMNCCLSLSLRTMMMNLMRMN